MVPAEVSTIGPVSEVCIVLGMIGRSAQKRVSRTTYQEHLKKAENKLVASLVLYFQLFRRVAPEKRNNVRAQYAVSPET